MQVMTRWKLTSHQANQKRPINPCSTVNYAAFKDHRLVRQSTSTFTTHHGTRMAPTHVLTAPSLLLNTSGKWLAIRPSDMPSSIKCMIVTSAPIDTHITRWTSGVNQSDSSVNEGPRQTDCNASLLLINQNKCLHTKQINLTLWQKSFYLQNFAVKGQQQRAAEEGCTQYWYTSQWHRPRWARASSHHSLSFRMLSLIRPVTRLAPVMSLKVHIRRQLRWSRNSHHTNRMLLTRINNFRFTGLIIIRRWCCRLHRCRHLCCWRRFAGLVITWIGPCSRFT